MDLESLWYEVSPYIYALGGVVALFNTDSTLSMVSGGLLLLASVTILRLRWLNRRKK